MNTLLVRERERKKKRRKKTTKKKFILFFNSLLSFFFRSGCVIKSIEEKKNPGIMMNKMRTRRKETTPVDNNKISRFSFHCISSILLILIIMIEKKIRGCEYSFYPSTNESHLIIKCGYVYIEIN